MGKDDNRLYIGVDLGGTGIKAGVVNAKHRVVSNGKWKTKAEEGGEAVVKRIAKSVRELMEQARLSPKDIGGLGIGAPGAINIEKGTVINAVNLRWTNFPLAKLLGSELGVPVMVDNDVNVGTWGEHVAGAAEGYDDVLGVFVGTGIGGGVVLGGKLYYGHFWTAGEIGHTIMQADAPRGRRTLENLASRTAVTNLLVQLIQSNHPSDLTKICEGDYSQIKSRALATAYDKGDRLTREAIHDAAHYVGVAIANVVTVLSLPCVVVGGGLSEAIGKPWLERVQSSFEKAVFPPELRACKVFASKLLDDAGVVGAADLARQSRMKASK